MSMHRELNPQLFGTQPVVEKIGHPVDPQQVPTGIMGRPQEAQPSRQVPYPPIDVKAIEHQINTLRVAMIQMEKRIEGMTGKIDEIGRGMHGRMERFSQAVIRLEEMFNQQNQETTGRFSQIAAKLNERKVSDSKIQELIDRHNMVVRNFENRLTSLQRVVNEQEMALHNAQAALEEARAALSKRN